MFNPIEPRVDQPSGRIRRRPSLGRIFFWSYLVGIPVVAVGAGVALLIASNQLDAAVQTYRSAVPCSAPTSTTCYTLVPGTLVKFTITRGKTGTTADMTLRLPDGTRSTWAKTNGQQENALRVGAPIRAEFYQGAITTVYLGAIGIQTKDSPVYKQSDMRLGAVLIPVLGLIIAAASFFTLRGQKQVMIGSLVAIDPTLPIVEQEALLRHALLADQPAEAPSVTAAAQTSVTLPFTLRPNPMPTGRPWWVGLVVGGIAVPLLLLRLRTPSSIGLPVLVIMVCAMLAGVFLHWRYRNGRRLVVDDLSVRRVNLFGAVRVVSRSDITRVACPIIMNFGMPAPEPRLLLLDGTGRCLLGLPRYYPTEDETAQLAAALRVPLDAKLATRLTASSRLRRAIPGAVSWPEAHPWLVSFALFVPIFVAICLFVWLLNGFK